MGYLSPVLIRNDCLHVIQDNPITVINGITDLVNAGQAGSVSVAGYTNAVEVLHTRHNSIDRLLIVAGNTIFDLETPDELVRVAMLSDWGRNFADDVMARSVDQLERLQQRLDQI